MGDTYIKSDETKKFLFIDVKNLYGHSMSQPLPNDEIKFDRNVKLEYILNFPGDSDYGYLIEVDLKYPDIIKGKTKISHLLLKLKNVIPIILHHI